MRQLFLDNARRVSELIWRPDVAARWDEPSALEVMTVGTLTAHLTRAATTVVTYLDVSTDDIAADASLLNAGQYFAMVLGLGAEHLTALNKDIVERAASDSAAGVEAVRNNFAVAIDTLTTRFEELTDDHVVATFSKPMRLDEYLKTRCVEMVVHSDDLTASLGIDPVDFDPAFNRTAIMTMADTATELHGATAVIHGLARAERSVLPVFPVF